MRCTERPRGNVTPDADPDPIAVAVSFAGTLERLGIPYLIGGSMASSVHGEPRSTNDIDIVADLTAESLHILLDAIRTDYYVSEDAAQGAVQAAERGEPGGSFNLIHIGGAIKVDLFVAGRDPFEAERLRSRQRIQVSPDSSASLFIDTAEHSLLRKLEWFRRGGEASDRQWRDVVAIARIQGDRLDRARLALWADRLGVSDLLVRLLAEVGDRRVLGDV